MFRRAFPLGLRRFLEAIQTEALPGLAPSHHRANCVRYPRLDSEPVRLDASLDCYLIHVGSSENAVSARSVVISAA
jgi:hypothetical protein